MNVFKKITIASLFLSVGSLPFMSSAETQRDLCAYDEAYMLALDPWEFDQGDEGWRRLDVHEECFEVAADLIRTYYQSYDGENQLKRLMLWHEGQLRADIGQTEEAIALFEQTETTDEDRSGWNYYVRATIAFLQEDRKTLLENREQLAQVPMPDDLPAMRDAEGNEIERQWPPNLHIVDNFVQCFGHSYTQASAGCNDE